MMLYINIIISWINWGRFAKPPPFEKECCGWVARVIADFVPRACQKCAPKSFSADGGDNRPQVFWQRKCHENVPKNMPNPSQIRLKIIEKRVRRQLRRLKSTNEGPKSIRVRSFCTFRPVRDYGLGLFWDQKTVFLSSKISSKNRSLQNHIFSMLFAISRASGARFSSILGPKSDPRRSFSGGFLAIGFIHDFWHFFLKKRVFHKL